MEKPIRVLHVLGGLSLGGAESRIMDLYRCMNREKVQFDFLVHQKDAGEGTVRIPEFYDEEVKKLGGNIYWLPKFKVYNFFQYKKAVQAFFATHREFAVVQGHMTSTASIYLPVARKRGVPVLCAHARSAGVDKGMKGLITRLLRLPLLHKADYCFACSKEAGVSVFGKKWEHSGKDYLIPNAIDAQKFVYDEAVREQVREEWELTDCYVLGHVGRFHYAKNHEFLLEIFAQVHEKLAAKGKRCALMLLGEGAGMEAAKEQAKQLGVDEAVIFAGNQADVWKFYQAFDFFVFPSRFEGLPGTVVEAQAAGLPCLISDRITPEVGISELVEFKSIDVPAKDWAEVILQQIEHTEFVESESVGTESVEYKRKDMRETIKQAGFDVKEQAVKMERFYQTGKMC